MLLYFFTRLLLQRPSSLSCSRQNDESDVGFEAEVNFKIRSPIYPLNLNAIFEQPSHIHIAIVSNCSNLSEIKNKFDKCR